MSLERRRGYIRGNEQSEGVLERWSLPSYDPSDAPPKETALNYDPGWEPPELVEEEQEPELDLSMLTADALEQIRHSASEEGYTEGREAGFAEGKEAGFEEGKAEGFEAGKTEGHQQGLEEGQQLIDERCQHLDAMLAKLAFPLLQVDHDVQQQMVELVLQLAKAVIQTEVQTNPQVILTTLREAVNALPMTGRQITIYLNPEDMDVVTSAHSVASLQDREWRLIAEPSLGRGDIQVACGDSVVDYRMEDRIRQMLSRFAGQNRTSAPQPPEDGLGEGVMLGADKVISGRAEDTGSETSDPELAATEADTSAIPEANSNQTEEIAPETVEGGDDDGQPV